MPADEVALVNLVVGHGKIVDSVVPADKVALVNLVVGHGVLVDLVVGHSELVDPVVVRRVLVGPMPPLKCSSGFAMSKEDNSTSVTSNKYYNILKCNFKH